MNHTYLVRILASLLLLLFLVVGYLVLIRRASTGVGMPEYSVFSPEKKGLQGVALQLEKLGFTPVAITRPIHQTGETGLLLIVEPPPGPAKFLWVEVGSWGPTPEYARRVLEWVERGNTLVLWGREQNSIHEELGVVLTNSVDDSGDTYPEDLAFTSRIDTIMLENSAAIEAQTDLNAIPLWDLPNEEGRHGAVLIAHGEGMVIVIADPFMITNHGRRFQDNALLVTDLVACYSEQRRVLFDEYSHGIRSHATFFSYLDRIGWLALLYHLFLVIGVACWCLAVRLGTVQSKREEKRTDAVDYAASMARVYQEAGLRAWVGEQLGKDFVSALRQSLRLKPGADHREILQVWKRRAPDSVAELHTLLDQAERLLERGSMSEGTLLETAQQFQRFRERFISNAHG